MSPADYPPDWPDVLRQVRGWSYPPGWYPVLRMEFGGRWFSVHLTRGMDETDAMAMELEDATGATLMAVLETLVDQAMGMPGGPPLTTAEIRNMGRWSR